MKPKWHILLGLVFAILFWAALPETPFYLVIAIFLSSFLIDFDHYTYVVWKTGKWSLKNALRFHELLEIAEQKRKKRGIFKKGYLNVFHTLEFHAIVLALGFIWPIFFYLLVGMLFHSITDFIYLIDIKEVYRREFFLANWVRRKVSRES